MLADQITLDVVFVLLVAAVVLFAWEGWRHRVDKAWRIPFGLACFAAAFLVQLKVDI
jgi:hypothetical protein